MRQARWAIVVVAVAALFVAIRSAAQRQPNRFDVLIKNGRIVDGTGAPWFRADLGIAGDRIAAVGLLDDASGVITVDATNLVVAPGFIDLLGQSEFNVLVDGRAASKILQFEGRFIPRCRGRCGPGGGRSRSAGSRRSSGRRDS